MPPRPPTGIPDAAFAAAAGALLLCGLAAPARAGGLDLDTIGGRAIGRAGVGVASEDGGAALLVNPAGLVRRTSLRAQLQLAVHDDDLSYAAPDDPSAPPDGQPVPVRDRGAAPLVPLLALQGSLGDVVLGASFAVVSDLHHDLPTPRLNELESGARFFPHRYGGTSLGFRRSTLAVGAAIRLGSWLGVGIAATASRVELAEARHLWAGFSGRDPLGDPSRDLALAVDGIDPFVPGATAGILCAPAAVPLELAASVSISADADLDGSVAVAPTHTELHPQPLIGDDDATTRLGSPLVLRTGLRWLGERVVLEANGELTLYPTGAAPTWQLADLHVIDETGASGQLGRLPSLVNLRDRAAARVAADVELIRGFLWLTAGYAVSTGAVPRARLSPVFADAASHTFAAGVEVVREGLTISAGYARTQSGAIDVDASAVEMVNPFDARPIPAVPGRYDTAHDAVGIAVEMSWE